MTTTDLKATYDNLEAYAQALQAKKDAAITEIRDQYNDQIRGANDEAAAAQKAWLDAEAADALKDRPDGRAVAEALGLTLPE